jgi:hypothetical protein
LCNGRWKNAGIGLYVLRPNATAILAGLHFQCEDVDLALALPATIVVLLAKSQHRTEASQENVAIDVPVSSSHTSSVSSEEEADTACRLSGVTATAWTELVCPARGVQLAAGLQLPHLEG